MVAPSDTPNRQLATMLLGQPVLDWVHDRRDTDPKTAWSAIAEELGHRTGGKVRVSREAIRQWYAIDRSEEAA